MATSTKAKAAQAQAEQRKRATVDMLRKKQPVERAVTLGVNQDDGTVEEVELLFRAISQKEYDRLVEKCPPTAADKKAGANYDIDKFAPLLISSVSADPEMSLEEAKEIWESDNWNRGELMNLFMSAVAVCTQGLDIPFTSSD